MFIIWTRVFYRELKHSSNQYDHYIREPSIVFFICNTRGENKSNSYLYLMIQVSVSNRVIKALKFKPQDLYVLPYKSFM